MTTSRRLLRNISSLARPFDAELLRLALELAGVIAISSLVQTLECKAWACAWWMPVTTPRVPSRNYGIGSLRIGRPATLILIRTHCTFVCNNKSNTKYFDVFNAPDARYPRTKRMGNEKETKGLITERKIKRK